MKQQFKDQKWSLFLCGFLFGLKLKFGICGVVQDLTRRRAKKEKLPGQTVYFITHKHPQMFSVSWLTLYLFSIDRLIKWKQNIVSLNWVNIIICSMFEMVLYLATIEKNGIRCNVN